VRPSPPVSGLTALELVSGLVFGTEPDGRGSRSSSAAARSALEAAVLPALRRPPCLVSFSGGRDSSCVLAVGVAVAREQGLPLPIPVTLRFRPGTEADESDWQELVVASLGLTNWLRLELGDDLDVVGPVATRALRRHGLLWPFNAYLHLPLLEAARGGSLLTGIGGDELFDSRVSRVRALLAGRVKPVPRDLLRLGLALGPERLRRAVARRRCPLSLRWLRPAAQHELVRAWAAESAQQPHRLAARADWLPRLRSLRLCARSLETMAAAEDVLLAHPLEEPSLAASVFLTPELAYADRAGRLRAILGDLLPDEVYLRSTKAAVNRALWGPHARELVGDWTGEGVDGELVDADALRSVWADDAPDGRSFLLLQAIWLDRFVAGERELR
jgi:asparagine synthase (glutamine-hydrolysing)